MTRVVLAVAAMPGFALVATAQVFSYPNFSSTAGLALLGNTVQSGSVLQLTASANQAGWVWRQAKEPVLAGFDTSFTFRITPPPSGLTADGLAFVIRHDPNGTGAQGGTAWGIGYGNGASAAPGISNSIVVEYDTHQDVAFNDSSSNELSIHTRGAQGNHEHEQWSIGRVTPAANLADGQVHALRVRYVPGTIQLFVDGAAAPVLTRPYNLASGGTYLSGTPAPGSNLLNGTAWVGFAATTRPSTFFQSCEVLSWSWSSTPLAHPCYQGTIQFDILTVEGSIGGPLRDVQLFTNQPFTIGIDSPPLFGAGAPYVLFLSLSPQPGTIGTQLGFGETCFPVLPLGPTELVLADTFGLLPAPIPALPTPYTIAIPAGVVTGPLAFTLQAVTLASLNPITLGISNAIDVSFTLAPGPVITRVVPLSATAG
jgi:hypothetical protein